MNWRTLVFIALCLVSVGAQANGIRFTWGTSNDGTLIIIPTEGVLQLALMMLEFGIALVVFGGVLRQIRFKLL
jgi:hypothetical protein